MECRIIIVYTEKFIIFSDINETIDKIVAVILLFESEASIKFLGEAHI